MGDTERANKLCHELMKKYWPSTWSNFHYSRLEVGFDNSLTSTAGRYVGAHTIWQDSVIYLSPHFPEESWSDTLLHELCHHFVRSHPNREIKFSPSHGKYFIQEATRVNRLVGREVVTTRHSMDHEDKYKRKLDKLLSLAKSPNEHEAALAAARAQALMMEHGITLNGKGLDVDEWLVNFSKQAENWRRVLWHGIAEANACHVFWRTMRGVGCRWYLIGRPDHIYNASLLGEYLLEVVEREVKKQKGKGRSFMNSFRVGMAVKLRSRLMDTVITAKKEGLSKEVTALVVVDHYREAETRRKDFVKQKGYRFHSVSCGSHSDCGGFNKGRKAGEKVSLDRQINTGGTAKRLK